MQVWSRNLNISVNLLILMFSTLLKPVFSLLISPRFMVVHSIVLAHSVRISIILVVVGMWIWLMMSVVLVLERIDIQKDVGVKASIVCWISGLFFSELNGTHVAEQGHDCQKSGLHYLYFIKNTMKINDINSILSN